MLLYFNEVFQPGQANLCITAKGKQQQSCKFQIVSSVGFKQLRFHSNTAHRSYDVSVRDVYLSLYLRCVVLLKQKLKNQALKHLKIIQVKLGYLETGCMIFYAAN